MPFNKSVLLLTENSELQFSKNVITAAKMKNLKLEICNPTFKTLEIVLSGQVGVFVMDNEELGRIGDLFFKSVRMHHCSVPALMIASKMILIEQLATYKFERNISAENLSDLLVKSLEFALVIESTEHEFSKKIDEIKHLTGDELIQAEGKLKREIFGRKFIEQLGRKECLKDFLPKEPPQLSLVH
ncbi:MAG: hypothetical protein AB7O96_13625 [Pseudobdellovibrionaceae bacterium]